MNSYDLRKHLRFWALPLVLWLGFVGSYLGMGLYLEYHRGLYHILPRTALQQEPLMSLLLAHAHPPMMSFWTAVLLFLERYSGLSPTIVGTTWYLAVQGATVAVWWVLARRILQSRVWALVVLGLYVTHPIPFKYGVVVTHTSFMPLVTGLWLLTGWRALRSNSPAPWALHGVAASALAFTHMIWHPLAVGGLLLVALALQRRWSVRSAAAAFLPWALLCGGWVAKNAILFNSPSFSSWRTDEPDRDTSVGYFLVRGLVVEQRAQQFFAPWQLELFARHPATSIVRETQPDGQPSDVNGNHFYAAVAGAMNEGRVASMTARLQYPAFPLRLLDVPGYMSPYALDQINGIQPDRPPDHVWAWHHNYHMRLYYGSWLGPLIAIPKDGVTLRPTFFSLVLLPGALLTLCYWLGFRGVRSHGERLLCLLALATVWVLVRALLGTSLEGGRHRWDVEVGLLVLIAWTLQRPLVFLRAARFGRHRAPV